MSRTSLLLLLVALLAACAGGDGDDDALGPSIVTDRLPDVRLNDSYDEKIEVTGGTPPYIFAVAAGGLPNGIELKVSTGQITGIAAEPGQKEPTIRVTDSAGKEASKKLPLYVVPDPFEVVTSVLPSGREAEPYNQTLVARGGVTPYAWSLEDGSLPVGLEVVSEGRVIGTPGEYGGFDFTVKVTDSEQTEQLQVLHLFVVSLNPVIQTSTIPKARQGEAYSTTLTAEGGVPPYSWDQVAGSLPAGVQLANDGSLGGVPQESGDFTFTAKVMDSRLEEAEVELTMRVIAPLTITTPSLPQLISGRSIDVTLEATGGEPPYEWSVEGDLPAGVTFEASGRLFGSSAEIGVHPLTVRVTDSEGFRDSALFELRVTDRFTYETTPMLAFPPTCTGTTVSYVTVPINVPDSYQVDDLDVEVTVDYGFNNGAPAVNDDLKLVLFSPGLEVQTPLCGDGAGVPGGMTCDGQGGIDKAYDDEGAAVNRPERPLAAFDGLNPQGDWWMRVAVIDPSCNKSGVLQRVILSIRDDRRTEDYVVVRGYTKNNLLLAPWVRITRGDDLALDEHDIYLSATVYSVGPNGIREGGKGDDVPDMVPLTWMVGGAPIPETTVTSDGHVRAGSLTGATTLTASGGGHVVNVPLYVVPPDWNPLVRVN